MCKTSAQFVWERYAWDLLSPFTGGLIRQLLLGRSPIDQAFIYEH